MIRELESNCESAGIRYFWPEEGLQGICHVVAPEMGLTQPGMTLCCGDSHTSTHGAFGAIAFGIGSAQICDALATQTLALSKLKVRRIEINGRLGAGVHAKDVALHVINRLGVKAGVGYAYEYAGSTVDAFSMDERMTLCNMAIEAGARCGYVNPDRTTYDYLRGRTFAPAGAKWDEAVASWQAIRSDADAQYDDVVVFEAAEIEPYITWGITPGQSVAVGHPIPALDTFAANERAAVREALDHMGFVAGQPVLGTPIDVAFIGSCTNGRFSDLAEVAEKLSGTSLRVPPHVRALVVPGSQEVRRQLAEHGYDKVFARAGFELRDGAGCSMCIGMNPDHLMGRQLCASSSNRNFKGRQGSPTGRTMLMSPVMVAAAALNGAISDARQVFPQ
jgi:3-isopropylmalate/(R)-2-methylmalate dehydratase large subunit